VLLKRGPSRSYWFAEPKALVLTGRVFGPCLRWRIAEVNFHPSLPVVTVDDLC